VVDNQYWYWVRIVHYVYGSLEETGYTIPLSAFQVKSPLRANTCVHVMHSTLIDLRASESLHAAYVHSLSTGANKSMPGHVNNDQPSMNDAVSTGFRDPRHTQLRGGDRARRWKYYIRGHKLVYN